MKLWTRRFSRSEAGSLYLLEEGPEGRRLRFKLAQNEAVKFAFSERTVAVDDRSLAARHQWSQTSLNLKNLWWIAC